MQDVRETADQDMVTSVATINSLLSQFQAVNTTIVSGTATGADISDALDQRSTLLQSLSKQIGITTTTNSNGSMSIYTDSGVTLFDTTPRSVTMTPTTTYPASTTGAAVYVDGVPVTGANAIMPIQSGALAGLRQPARQRRGTHIRRQLDSIAGGLVNAFAETSSYDRRHAVAGLFTYPARPRFRLDAGHGPRRRDHGHRRAPIPRGAAPTPASATARSTAPPSQNTSNAAGYSTLHHQDMSRARARRRPIRRERRSRPPAA